MTASLILVLSVPHLNKGILDEEILFMPYGTDGVIRIDDYTLTTETVHVCIVSSLGVLLYMRSLKETTVYLLP